MSEKNKISSEIIFEKAKDYKRFYMTGSIVNVNTSGEFQIELYEDVNMPADKVVFFEDKHPDVHPNHPRVSRIVHTGIVVAPHHLESLINELQKQHNDYLAYLETVRGDVK